MLQRFVICVLAAGAFVFPDIGRSQSERFAAVAALQSDRVYVGQQFLLQVQIEGTDQPDPIDIRVLERDFIVTEAGGGPSNSTSVSIINGQMTQQVRRSYSYNYRIAARQPGEAVIPPLTVTSAGRSTTTQPVRVQILPPEEIDDFRLRLSLSEDRAYVGQPLRLTTTWYIGREVQDFSFTMPLLDDRRFEILEPPADSLSAQDPGDLIEIRLGDRRATARRGTRNLDGVGFTVLEFEKLIVPRSTGSVALPAATVTFSTPGRGTTARRSLFDDFFGGGAFSGMFGSRRMETLAIPSNQPSLEVLELPPEGRPARFNGWIGNFELSTEATPVIVSVGEPITLTLTVKGSVMLPSARFPALDQQPELASAFNVPKEIGAAESNGNGLAYRQTLRARSDRITEIPGVELPYFDPRRRQYRVARSEPIALTVNPARVVTAEDAEGRGPSEARQLEVESSERDIVHNYVDVSALLPSPTGLAGTLRPLGPLPFAVAVLVLPPLLLAAVGIARFGVRVGNPSEWMVATQRRRWTRAVQSIDLDGSSGEVVASSVLTGLRGYLGSRLGAGRAGARAWTYGDVERELDSFVREGRCKLASPDTLALLRSVFERCEAGTYAGIDHLDTESKRRLVKDAGTVVDRLEEGWR